MSDNEMKDIWMNADGGNRLNIDLSQLQVNLKDKMKRMDRGLFFRDAREIVAAVVVIVVYGYRSYMENMPVSKLANILIVIWGIYVIYRLLDVRKYKKVGDSSSSLRVQLEQQKIYLQQQAHLLDSVFVWYIAPPAVLIMLSINGRSYSEGFEWRGFLLSLIVVSLVSLGIYVLNKRAARTAYQPLIENIDHILTQMDEDSL